MEVIDSSERTSAGLGVQPQQFVVVQNKGEADFRNLRLIGLSTKRGASDKIGCYGSGLKNSLALFARLNCLPTIFIGEKKITLEIDNGEIIYVSDDGSKIPSSIHTGFGAIDWKDPWFGFRDIISNAMDEGEEGYYQTTKQVVGEPGITKVVIPITSDRIMDGWLAAQERFIDKSKIYFKEEKSRIFKKGVWVTDYKDCADRQKELWFSYNLNDLHLTESRTTNPSYIQSSLYNIFSGNDTPADYYHELLRNKENAGEFDVSLMNYLSEIGQNFKHAFTALYGNAVVTPDSLDRVVIERLYTSGLNIIPVGCWYKAVSGTFPELDYKKYLEDGTENIGKILDDYHPSDEIDLFIENIYRRYFKRLGKPKPQVKWFSDKPELRGKATKEAIWLNKDYMGLTHDFGGTVIEEMAHYYSGYSDCTRDFQTFLISTLSRRTIEKIIFDMDGEID